MAGLKILSGLYSNIDPEIFQTLFQGWQTNHCVKISYADWQNEITERNIEPHTLVFYNNSWYTKAFCHLKKQQRTFALRRIKRAELLKGDFEVDKEIIDSVNPDTFLNFEKIKNVKLHAENYSLDQLKSVPLHSDQIIHDDGTVEIPAVSKEVLFPFILSQEGNVKLLEPASLKEEFKANLKKMLKQYC